MSLFEELKRRNVVRVAIFYLVGSWLILQVADLVFGALELPSSWLRLVLALLLLGFTLVLILAWVYELTPEGLKRKKDIDRSRSFAPETGKKLDHVIMIVPGVALLSGDGWHMSELSPACRGTMRR